MTATAGTGGRWRPTSLGLLGDERLARHAGAGDAQAFAVVYERYHHALYRYCRSILHNDADAQDALQSTFAAAFAALRNEQRDAPMRPWLFRIAHNESISALRRRRPAFELSAASEQGTASVEDEVAGRAEIYLLLRDLRELTDRQRSALVLRELSGLSHEEIAIALGTSVGGAKQMIFEARRALFEFAQGRDMACDEIRKTISDADGRSLRARRVRAHLRECTACAAFAGGITARTERLRALAPVLPAGMAAGLLGRVAASHIGRGGGSGLARLAAGAASKGATVGAGLGANALAGVAVVASATVGVSVGVDKFVHAMSPARASGAAAVSAVKAAHPSSLRFEPSPTAGARSATEHRATGFARAASTPSKLTPRMRRTGLAALARASHTVGAAAVAWPRGSANSAPAPVSANGGAGAPAAATPVGGQAAGAASSAANAPGRDASGAPGSWGSGHSSGPGDSHSAGASSSTGSESSPSSGSGRRGSGGSGHSHWDGSASSNANASTNPHSGQPAASSSQGSEPSGSAESSSPGGAGHGHGNGNGDANGNGNGNGHGNTNPDAPAVSNAVGTVSSAVNGLPSISTSASPVPSSDSPADAPPVPLPLPLPTLPPGHHGHGNSS